MEFRLCKADRNRRKLQMRGDLWDGTFVKLPAHRDTQVSEQMCRDINSLNRSKLLGELPDPAVVARLSADVAERYVELGLLESRFLDRRRPLEDLLPEFLEDSKPNCKKRGSRAPRTKVSRVRLVLREVSKVVAAKNRAARKLGNDDDNVKAVTIKDITQPNVNTVLDKLIAVTGRRRKQPISQKTRREYVFALKSFCEWLVDTNRVAFNPLRKMQAPAAKGDPVWNRRPLETDDFSKLVDYLTHAPDRYSHQMFDWSPLDRLMVYWTAVVTGFRKEELRSLTRAQVGFHSEVPTMTVQGWVAKNGEKAKIPVPPDFAAALDNYSAHLHPTAPLLRFPTNMTRALYRDLDAAGVRRNFDDGALVDFHTLRSTAIYWWVTKNKLHLLDVQCMARLKTLALVQEYVDNYAPNFKSLIMNAPRLVEVDLPFQKAGRETGRAVA